MNVETPKLRQALEALTQPQLQTLVAQVYLHLKPNDQTPKEVMVEDLVQIALLLENTIDLTRSLPPPSTPSFITPAPLSPLAAPFIHGRRATASIHP